MEVLQIPYYACADQFVITYSEEIVCFSDKGLPAMFTEETVVHIHATTGNIHG